MAGRRAGAPARWLRQRHWDLITRRSRATVATVYRSRRPRHGGVSRLDAVVVINLAHRPDRLADFMDEMRRLRIAEVRRFEAIEHASGSIGCSLSHIACLQTMVHEGWNAAMICEDDASFLASRGELDILTNEFLDDPEAEIACLAYNHRSSAAYSSLFLRALETANSACYLLKASIAPDLLTVRQKGVQEMERGGDRMRFGNDRAWLPLQRERVFLIPIRRAVVQAPSYSDIEKQFVRYLV
jgi:hypothetical protein